MFDRLENVEQRYLRLEEELSNPEILANQKEYQKTTREHAEIASSGRDISALQES